MKELFLDMLKGLFLGICFVAIFFVIASVSRSAYSNTVHPHDELALAGYNSLAHTVRSGLFLCVISLCVRISMAKLERDIFICAGFLTSLSANPFQLCHHYLAVIGKASKQSLGAHFHA